MGKHESSQDKDGNRKVDPRDLKRPEESSSGKHSKDDKGDNGGKGKK